MVGTFDFALNDGSVFPQFLERDVKSICAESRCVADHALGFTHQIRVQDLDGPFQISDRRGAGFRSFSLDFISPR